MQARVYKSTGNWYQLQDADGNRYNGRIQGRLRLEGLTSTNPVAVGDTVDIEMENELEKGVTITHIHDRRNYITRVSPANKHHHHIIASNLDQSLLFATLKDPKTSLGFIDRFLVTSEAYRIPAMLIYNKSDLYKKKEMDRFAEVKGIYEKIGYRVFKMSVETGEGVDEVSALLKDKTSLLSGHSGVGKSSFINTIFPEINLKTQDVSGWSGKGLHTTTFAEMFDLPFGGQIIDTPGIRELGLVDIEKQELSHYFPEMARLINDCQFNNCMHMNEPGCAIKDAVGAGEISMDRYLSYCNILETINEKGY